MSATLRIKTLKSRRRPGFRSSVDYLEGRVVLSTTSGSGASVLVSPFEVGNPLPPSLSLTTPDPIFNTTITNASPSITLEFDRPIDPGSLVSDVEINQVDAFGNLTPIENLGNSVIETSGPDGQSIIVTTSQSLTPGIYNVVLLGGGGVTGLDGSALSPTEVTLGSFTIVTPDVTLADATDLGKVSDAPISVTANLDPATPFQDVRLYKITLPHTHKTWRLGLEVYSTRIQSSLLTNLALLDENGNVVATSQTGRTDSPQDPFLFDGVKPGVYYVGISASGNLPGSPNGYDPINGIAGQAPANASAGNFRLNIAADSADTPTVVKTFFLNHADTNDQNQPTGLTFQFSASMNEVALRQANLTAIKLVDANGVVWTAHSTSYDESTATTTFDFDKILPEGTYTVLLGGKGQLVNLANQAPLSPGYPEGTLAMFQVGPPKVKTDPYDLGVLPLASANQGISRTLDLAAHQSVTYRVVVMVPGIYDLQTNYSGGSPIMYATLDGRQIAAESGAPGVLQRNDLELSPGVVTYTLSAGDAPATIKLLFKLSSSLADQLLINGVGQSSALSLRLVNPASISSGFSGGDSSGYGPNPVVTSAPSNDGSNVASSGGNASPSATSTTTSVSTSASVPALLVTPLAGLLGHPSAMSEQVAFVGPVSPNGQSALAYNGNGLPLGLNARSSANDRAGKPLNNGDMFSRDEPNQPEFVDTNLGKASVELLPPKAEALDELPTGNGLLERVAGIVSRLFSGESSTAQPKAKLDLDNQALAQVDGGKRAGNEEPATEELVETADLSQSAGVTIVAVVAAVLQRKAAQWRERRRIRLAAKPTMN